VKRLTLALAGMLISGGTASADVLHNGSVMEVITYPDHIDIQYAVPRSVLYSVGVHQGTVMLSGRFQGQNTFHGTAWVFTQYCGSFPYEVNGYLADGGALIVEGPEPDVRSDCNVYGYYWGKRSHLVPTFLCE
jgi:hypothetical protein